MNTAGMKTAAAGHLEAEELMALADGELSGTTLAAAEQHVAGCAACAGEVVAFQEQKRALAGWIVEPVPPAVEDAVLARLRSGSVAAHPKARVPSGWGWVWGGAGVLTAGALAVMFVMTSGGRSAGPVTQSSLVAPAAPTAPVTQPEAKSAPAPVGADESAGGMSDRAVRMAQSSQPAPASNAAPAPAEPRVMDKPLAGKQRMRQPLAVPDAVEAPMIARSVALTLTVKDVERSREGLENLLRAYGGYAAQMEVNTPGMHGSDSGVRSLTASLRVPAGALRGMLAELKGYGKVDLETQSGEEVGQQHADLAARLNTARASEERLRGILKTRTGDVSEVLEVEEQIATVREQIEQMEAEQQGLEHRVSYATVDLTLNEEGQGPAARTVGSRLAAGARAGWNNAVDAVLGLVTFLLEYGLATVLVVVMLGLPAWWLWRRWRRVRARW